MFKHCEPAANIMVLEDGSMWYEITEYNYENSHWIHLGIAPKPKSKLDWFIYHVCMGIISKYPLRHIIIFSIESIKNKNPFSGVLL